MKKRKFIRIQITKEEEGVIQDVHLQKQPSRSSSEKCESDTSKKLILLGRSTEKMKLKPQGKK